MPKLRIPNVANMHFNAILKNKILENFRIYSIHIQNIQLLVSHWFPQDI